MNTEVGAIDDSSDGKLIKEVHEDVIYLRIILFYALRVEVELLGRVSRLMISSQQTYVAGLGYLQGAYICHDFGSVYTSIDVITEKN